MCGVLNPVLSLAVQGPVVSAVVQLLKRIPWVEKHPKVVAAFLNLLAVGLAGVAFCDVDLGNLFSAWLAGFAGSLTTYETVVKPLTRDEKANTPTSGSSLGDRLR